MRKIIRLTERDLTRLVKRVIREQATPTTNPDQTSPKKPFPFGVNFYGNLYSNSIKSSLQLNVLGVEGEHPNGCIFRVQIRSTNQNKELVVFCSKPEKRFANLIVPGASAGDDKVIGGEVSPEAYELLAAHCDCGSYVKSGSFSSNVA